jgi:hypothetical protein
MPPRFYLLWVVQLFERGEHRDGNIQFGQFIECDRRKTIVLGGSRDGTPGYGLVKRIESFAVADAAAEPASMRQGDESGSHLSQLGIVHCNLASILSGEMVFNAATGEP